MSTLTQERQDSKSGGQDVWQEIQDLKKEQEVQVAAQTGAHATQAAAMAGLGAAVIAGAAGLVVGIFIGALLSD